MNIFKYVQSYVYVYCSFDSFLVPFTSYIWEIKNLFQCYCLGSDVQDHTETECTDKCDSPLVACGNDAYPVNNSYLSIYKMNTDGKIDN